MLLIATDPTEVHMVLLGAGAGMPEEVCFNV